MTRYYTLNTATNDLVSLELPVVIDGKQRLHPTPAQAAALGAYPRNDTYYPTDDPPEGKMWRRSTGWTVRDGRWCADFEAVDIPAPPPRRWSRLSLKTALAQAGMLAAARSYLAGVEVAPGYMAAEALTDCDYIEEGFPTAERWGALLDGAAQALGKTRADIDAFLDSLPTEDGT